MRLLILLGLVLAAPLCAGQQVIERVREIPSGKEVARGGIFDPDAGLRVELNALELRKQLKVPGDDKEVAAVYRRLDAYAQSARKGVAALERAATGDPAAIGAVSDALNAVIQALGEDNPAIKIKVNARIGAEAGGSLDKATRIAFEAASARADELRTQLFQEVPRVDVHLDLSRTTDTSREPDATFGILPGPDSRAALNAFIANFDTQGHNLRNVTPAGVWQGVVGKFKTDALATYNDLKTKADALAQGYAAKADAAAKGFVADSPEAKAWQGVAADAKAVADGWSTTKANAESLLASTAESQEAFNAFVTRANALSASVQDLQAKLTTLSDDLSHAPLPNATDAQRAEADLKKLASDALASAKLFVQQSVGSVGELVQTELAYLGLVDVLKSIAQTSAEARDGGVDFTTVDGRVPGLVPIHSYDRLRVTVQLATPTTGNAAADIGGAYDIWAWKRDRIDNVLAVGFYPRKDSNRWSVAPIVGQVYKFTLPSQSFAVNRNLPGIGYSVALLDQDDDGQQEVGLGAMLSLFDDHLVGGYGYNLSGKGGYWYVGYRFPLRR